MRSRQLSTPRRYRTPTVLVAAFCLGGIFCAQRAVAVPPKGGEEKPEPPPAVEKPAPAAVQQKLQLIAPQVLVGPLAGAKDGDQTVAEDVDESVFYPADRATVQRLNKARELLDSQRYSEAVRFLGSILEGPEDYFFRPDPDRPIYRSIKAEAQRLIGQMPTAGWEAYQREFGAVAQRLLDSAIADGDQTRLAEISRRFFHTESGYQATALLGNFHLDHGRPMAASLCFKRLQEVPRTAKMFGPELWLKAAVGWARAGMMDQAVTTLVAMKERFPNAQVAVGQQPRPLFADDAQAAVWLAGLVGPQLVDDLKRPEQWAMYRGDATRNAASVGNSPLLNRRWAVPVTNDPYVEKNVAQVRDAFVDQGVTRLPGLHPLAVGDYVFMRSISGLVAVDFETGKRIWNGPADQSVRQFLEPLGGGGSSFQEGGVVSTGIGQPLSSGVAEWLEDRIWSDTTYGTISSDGQSVFCVEDLGVVMNLPGKMRTIIMANGRMVANSGEKREYNRLAAYDIATEGKLKWEIGGAQGENELEMAGAFFLGPPLPLGGLLYVLAEMKGEVRLLVLDGQNGQLQWSQQLAQTELNTLFGGRSAGVSPSYSDGVMVCPTSAGAVVAVDVTTRSLLWGYQYPQSDPPEGNPALALAMMRGMPTSEAEEGDRWADASVTICEGRVLLTPPESKELHCLSLIDGSLLWKNSREDGIYVACVHRGNVVVVGRSTLRAYRLADGEAAWGETGVTLPNGSAPSGRGFYNGDRYYLPLTTAEVAAVDLHNGNIVASAKSRTGQVPGNLICYKGAVISQGVDSVESFHQIEVLRDRVTAKLGENPDDAATLALHGELLLDDGKLDEAIGQLRRALGLRPDPRTQMLLVDALLEGLRQDFATYRRNRDEIERLIDQPSQQTTYLRQVAAGLQQAGEIESALEIYLKIRSTNSSADELERVSSVLSVRRDRWIRGSIARLRDDANPQQLAAMDDLLGQRLKAAKDQEGPEALREFIDSFSGHPQADVAREELATRLSAGGNLLEAQQLLRRLEQSADPQRSRAAAARIAQMLHQADRADEGAAYFNKLSGPWAELECLDGKTGRELLAAWQIEHKSARPAEAVQWPEGRVDVTTQQVTSAPRSRQFVLELRGDKGPFLASTTFEMDQQQQALVATDGLGRERWRLSLGQPGQRNIFSINPTLSYARADGHLLLIAMGYRIVAIDALGNGKSPRVLWSKDLTELFPGMPALMGIHGRVVNLPWGVARFVASDAFGRPVGNTGPVNDQFVCFQRHRKLIAVHPLTGETLWVRNDTQPGSDIFGDEQYLFITAPNAGEAMVVRPTDGELLGRRKVPPFEEQLAVIGRRVLAWKNSGGKDVLRLVDAWTSEEVWKREFTSGSKPWPVGNEAVGVMQRDGHFVLLAIADGKAQIDTQLDPEPSLTDIYMFRSAGRDLLVTNRPWQNRNGLNIQPVPGGFGNPLINGLVYGFDRKTGKQVFKTEIESQGLTLSQPSELPVLVFASQLYEVQGNRGRTPRAGLLCIDKRDGRVLYDTKTDGSIGTVEIEADTADNAVVIKTLRNSVRFTFTDEPKLEPKPEPKEPPEKSASTTEKVGRAIFRGLQKWVETDLAGPVPVAQRSAAGTIRLTPQQAAPQEAPK